MGSIWDGPSPTRKWIWPWVLGWLVLVATGIGIAWFAFQGVADLARPL
jgi:hypothetical protein